MLSSWTAWVLILPRVMSLCQLLRFISADLMDQLQTPFLAMGHPKHLHIMGRTMPRLLTATQPDPTNSTYNDKFLHIRQPLPTEAAAKGIMTVLSCSSDGIGSHRQKFQHALQNKDQTRSYYLVQTVFLPVNRSFSAFLNTLCLL